MKKLAWALGCLMILGGCRQKGDAAKEPTADELKARVLAVREVVSGIQKSIDSAKEHAARAEEELEAANTNLRQRREEMRPKYIALKALREAEEAGKPLSLGGRTISAKEIEAVRRKMAGEYLDLKKLYDGAREQVENKQKRIHAAVAKFKEYQEQLGQHLAQVGQLDELIADVEAGKLDQEFRAAVKRASKELSGVKQDCLAAKAAVDYEMKKERHRAASFEPLRGEYLTDPSKATEKQETDKLLEETEGIFEEEE